MDYSYYYSSEAALDEMVSSIAAASSVGSSVSSMLGMAAYVFTALALYTIAKRRGISKAWLAWIPVVDVWILGSISDQFRYVVKGEVKSKRKILLILNIALTVIGFVILAMAIGMLIGLVNLSLHNVSEDRMMQELLGSVMGILGVSLVVLVIAIAEVIVRYMALYDLYTSCEPANNALYLVLSIIPGVATIALPLLLFLCREKDGGMPPRRPEPQPQILEPQWSDAPIRENEPWNNTQE